MNKIFVIMLFFVSNHICAAPLYSASVAQAAEDYWRRCQNNQRNETRKPTVFENEISQQRSQNKTPKLKRNKSKGCFCFFKR